MNKMKSLFLITSILSSLSFNAHARQPTESEAILDYTNDQYYFVNNHENFYDLYKIVGFDNVQVVDKLTLPLSQEEIKKYSKYQDKWIEPDSNIDFTNKKDNFFKFVTEKAEKSKYEDVIITVDVDNYNFKIQYQYDKNLIKTANELDVIKYYNYKFKNDNGKIVDKYNNVYGVYTVEGIVYEAVQQYKQLGDVNQNYIISSLTNKIKNDPVFEDKLTNVKIEWL